MRPAIPALVLLGVTLFTRVAFWNLPSLVLPRLDVATLGIPAAVGLAALQNPYNRLVAFLWLAWWWIGNLNLIGSYVAVGNYYAIDVNRALRTYLLFADVFVFGLWLGEHIMKHRTPGFGCPLQAIRDDLPQSFRGMTLVFPFAWVISMYLSLGYLPLAKGEDITFEMYNSDHGPLYGFAAVCASSVIYGVFRGLRADGTIRLRWLTYAAVVVLLSVLDGKRFVALIALIASFVLLAQRLQERTWRALPLAGAVVAGMYVGIALLRQGMNASAQLSDIYYRLAMIGVEFRDFALSMELFEPGRVPGYEWASSALAAMINGKILTIVGVDKAAEVRAGSAYVWMEILGTGLGVRTGIVSELWFAYGWAGSIIVFFFGVATSVLTIWLVRANTFSSLLFGAQVYALAVIEINGQTTAGTGTLAVLGYLWLALAVLRRLERGVVMQTRPRLGASLSQRGGAGRGNGRANSE